MARFSSLFITFILHLCYTYYLVAGLPPGTPNDQDIEVLSNIKRWAAIGDSYSAGIGAGSLLPTKDNVHCRRYSQSYPSLMSMDYRLGVDTGTHFDYLSCSGAKSPEILKQAKQLQGQYDLITVSAGGNDLGFSRIIISCIYIGWGGCVEAMADAEKQIDSAEFKHDIQALLRETGKHLAKGGALMWTGYSTFYDETTTACDTVDVGLDMILPSYPQKLTREFRKRINKMVRNANTKLASLVKEAGHTFVDYGEVVDGVLAKFCAPGIDESQHVPLDSPDTSWHQPWYSMFFENEFGLKHDDFRAAAAVKKTTIDPRNYDHPEGFDLVRFMQHLGLPTDRWMKWFHPRPVAHALIANYILHLLAERRAKTFNVAYPPMVVQPEDVTCARKSNPVVPKPKPHPLWPELEITCASKERTKAIDIDIRDAKKLAYHFCTSGKGWATLHSKDVGLTTYSEYDFYFKYDRGIRPCSEGCHHSFYKMFARCEGQDSHSLQASATAVNQECHESASYNFHVPIKVQPVQCLDKSLHPDLNYLGLVEKSAGLCESYAKGHNDYWMMRGKEPIQLDRIGSVSWIKGCRGLPQSILNPMMTNVDPATPVPAPDCKTLLYNSWAHCGDNDGSGGYIDVGCVRYKIDTLFTPKKLIGPTYHNITYHNASLPRRVTVKPLFKG